ncbi:MAG: hypothetical protein EP326_11165 [Deltaproteobacteria bacterium]|nr:MAG: hypothetical protein EP326_11165 [Deltaproteobacteria bacterium]
MSRVVLFSTLVLSLIFGGCTTVNKSQRNGSIDIVVQSHLKAEIDVDMNRVLKGTATESVLFGFITLNSNNHFADGVSYNGGDGGSIFFGGLTDKAKAAAAYVAVKKAKDVDVIVAPQYVIKTKSVLGLYKKVTATVTGYAGTIKRFKKI